MFSQMRLNCLFLFKFSFEDIYLKFESFDVVFERVELVHIKAFRLSYFSQISILQRAVHSGVVPVGARRQIKERTDHEVERFYPKLKSQGLATINIQKTNMQKSLTEHPSVWFHLVPIIKDVDSGSKAQKLTHCAHKAHP